MRADSAIRTVLEKYGETFNDAGTVWRVQGTAVISHKALERIAAKAGVVYAMPTIIRAERDEAVIMVSGSLDDRTEWSIGEALVNVNYRVSGKQAGYVWAMAEKRAKDRVILKLVSLHGLAYSEEEADEFKGGSREAMPASKPAAAGGMSVDQMMHEVSICMTDADLVSLKADPDFRAGYKAADEVSRKRIEGALVKAAEDCAA